MKSLRTVLLTLAFCGLAACEGGTGIAPDAPEVDDFTTRVFAAGAATNPCHEESENLTGFWLSLEAKRPGVETTFEQGNPKAFDAQGQEYPMLSVVLLDSDMVDLNRMGSANFCGGSGGVGIEGTDRTWGSVSQMSISFPYANEETENHITFDFGAFGTVWMLLFFDVPFESIEEIRLSNGQVISRSVWESGE